jgi:hypothetical protein
MEVKITLSQIVLAIVQLVGYAVTAVGIAYYFGKKVSHFETTMKFAMEQVKELAEEVKTISNRMWDERKGK